MGTPRWLRLAGRSQLTGTVADVADLRLTTHQDHLGQRIWWCPDDADWMFNPDKAEEQYGGSYLQAGGTAEKMSVELRRREDDGEYRFSIVGRDHDLTELRLIADM